MRRFGPGWGWSLTPMHTGPRDRARRRQLAFDVTRLCFDAGGGTGGGGGGGDDDAPLTDELKASNPDKYYRLYWKKESGAAAAFKERDETKRRITELEKGQMTPEQRKEYDDLKAAQAKQEEERKRKEGEFDAWRADINKRHTDELTQRDSRLTALEQAIADGEVRRAFLAESDLFGGGEHSKTVLVGQMAVNALGSYVRYEEYDFGGETGKQKTLVVRDGKGHIIRGQDGRPAPFKEAIESLIKALPEKDHILRGSGKTGSGARGEGVLDDHSKVDLGRPLTSEQKRDPNVRKQLEALGGGGLQMGRGFSKAAVIAGKK